MRIAFGVILVTGIFGVFAAPVTHDVITKDLDTTVDKMYKSYVSISNDRADKNQVDVISRVQQVLDSPKAVMAKNGKQPKTAYLLVKTMRQRNKRYISYLTLCHFKICNMGRKRTTRYFHTIRRPDDNDA